MGSLKCARTTNRRRQGKSVTLDRKILIGAYACEPNKGSEPEAGWQWVRAAGRTSSRVVVLTRSNNRDAIEAVAGVPEGIKFEYFDLSQGWKSLKKRLPYGTQLYYFVWQIKARRRAQELHARERF